jgi:hypothetical protein
VFEDVFGIDFLFSEWHFAWVFLRALSELSVFTAADNDRMQTISSLTHVQNTLDRVVKAASACIDR